MKIVKVNWIDPCFCKSGWMDKDDFSTFCHSKPSRSTTIGILAHQDKKSIVILQTIGENSVADAVKINRASIVDLKVISNLKEIALSLHPDPEKSVLGYIDRLRKPPS